MSLQSGDRVRITGEMPGGPGPLSVGSTGTVVRVITSSSAADVKWDSGRSLFLLTDVDSYEVIARAEVPEPTCKGMAGIPGLIEEDN